MMKKEYRNRLIITGLLLLGIILFALVDGYFRYAPEDNNPGTEQVGNTEV